MLRECYRRTVADIVAAGYLRGEQSTAVYDIEHWPPPGLARPSN